MFNFFQLIPFKLTCVLLFVDPLLIFVLIWNEAHCCMKRSTILGFLEDYISKCTPLSSKLSNRVHLIRSFQLEFVLFHVIICSNFNIHKQELSLNVYFLFLCLTQKHKLTFG